MRPAFPDRRASSGRAVCRARSTESHLQQPRVTSFALVGEPKRTVHLWICAIWSDRLIHNTGLYQAGSIENERPRNLLH